MNKNKYIKAIEPCKKPKNYLPKTKFIAKEQLEKKLQSKGLKIKLGDVLKGGTTSQVYEGILDNNKVIVKHVEDITPFDPTEFFISRKGINIDVKVLKLLAKENKVQVPGLLYYFPDVSTLIMEDVREKGFELMSNQLLKGKLLLSSAEKIGKSLAYLAQISRKWKEFKTNESVEQSIYERGLELRLVYPNTQKEYLFLEKEFTKNNQCWVWPDGHPKNMFVNKKGEVVFIDFGRSHWGDQRYMLPNFLAHILIYAMVGYLDLKKAREYIEKCIKSYKKLELVNEKIFCQYLAMEVVHRAGGKWIDGIKTKKQKLSLYGFGLEVFDKKLFTIGKVLKLLKR